MKVLSGCCSTCPYQTMFFPGGDFSDSDFFELFSQPPWQSRKVDT